MTRGYTADIVGAIIMILVAVIGFLVVIPLIIIDGAFLYPQAAENANQFCQSEGYDFYERFERIGILSTIPVAIKCKYVDNYKEMDIKLRQTFESAGVEEED